MERGIRCAAPSPVTHTRLPHEGNRPAGRYNPRPIPPDAQPYSTSQPPQGGCFVYSPTLTRSARLCGVSMVRQMQRRRCCFVFSDGSRRLMPYMLESLRGRPHSFFVPCQNMGRGIQRAAPSPEHHRGCHTRVIALRALQPSPHSPFPQKPPSPHII